MQLSKSTTCIASLLLTFSPHVLGAAFVLTNATVSASPALVPRSDYINCKGNEHCRNGFLDDLIAMANANSEMCTVGPHKAMFCISDICVYTDDTKDALTWATVQSRLDQFKKHGCYGCGHVSLTYPKDDGKQGTLVVDVVEDERDEREGIRNGCFNEACNQNCLPKSSG